MMDNSLYVVCGIANHEIYIADRNNALAMPVPCTKSAVLAVRDYMVDSINDDSHGTIFQWKRDDGKTVKLMCVIED